MLFETMTGGYFRVYTDDAVKLGEVVPMRLVRLYQDGFWGSPA